MRASKPMLDKIDDELGAWCMMKKATTFETYLESLEISKRLCFGKDPQNSTHSGSRSRGMHLLWNTKLSAERENAGGDWCNSKTLRFLSDERWHGGSICRETIWF